MLISSSLLFCPLPLQVCLSHFTFKKDISRCDDQRKVLTSGAACLQAVDEAIHMESIPGLREAFVLPHVLPIFRGSRSGEQHPPGNAGLAFLLSIVVGLCAGYYLLSSYQSKKDDVSFSLPLVNPNPILARWS